MRRILKLTVLLCVCFLSGCFSPMKVASVSTYTITDWPKSSIIAGKTHIAKTLLVTIPVAAPGYDSARMIYVMVPYQLKSFGNYRWVAAPADLLLPLITNHIRALNYFHAVMATPFSGAANYQLNTRLLTLQQEFMQPESKVRLTMEATIVKTTTGQVISSRVFEVTVPASENNPYAGVLATNEAARIVTNQIAQFVVNAVKKVSNSTPNYISR